MALLNRFMTAVNLFTATSDPASPNDGDLWYRSDTGKVRSRVGGATQNQATEAYVDARVLRVVKSADETVTSSTALQNDDHLLLTPAISTVYLFEGWLLLSGGLTGDIQVAFTFPTGARLVATALGSQLASTAGAATSMSTLTWGPVATIPHIGFGFGTYSAENASIFFQGTLTMGSTAGNLQLTWAQQTSNATGTVINAKSWIRLEPA